MLEILHELASEMNKAKREIIHGVSLLTGITEVVWPWQVTNYSKMFKIGSLRLTHGRIIIFPANRGTREQQRGLSEAAPSRNGSCPDQIHYYGFMENVSSQSGLLRND